MQSLEEQLPAKLRRCLAEGNALRQIVFVGETMPEDIDVGAIEVELSKGRYKMPHFLKLRGSLERGRNSSVQSAVEIASYVQSLSSACIVPFIEDRIRELEIVISSCRRGLKNQLKTFLFRKTPSESNIPRGDVDAVSSYGDDSSLEFLELKSNSIESAMRQQSDLLLMVGDYTTAVSTLKLLSTDLKSDRLYFHFASAQECLAFAHLVGGISISSAILYFKEAFIRYASLVDIGNGFWSSVSAMCCTRVALQWSGLLFAMDRFSEASWIVMRAHFYENNLRSAFLLQFSAFCLLQQQPLKQRKRGFHLVLAALRYSQANQNKIASLLHKEAYHSLQGHGWDILEEHIHEALDHEYSDSGESSKALGHAMAMLQCHSLPSPIQAHHMSHLLGIHEKLIDQEDIFPIELGVPIFDTSHLSIVSAGNCDYHDLASREISSKIWKDIETFLPKRGSSHSRPGSAMGSKQGRLSSCAGEDIIINIPARNPLKIDLHLSHIDLIYSMNGVEGIMDDVSAHSEHLHLYPGETSILSLKCRPVDSGTLKVDGLVWKLANMPCKKIFVPSVSKWAVDKEMRDPKGGSIEFDILPPMPRLHINMTTLPQDLVVGEIFECVMELSNEGSIGLCNVDAVTTKNVFLTETLVEEMNDGIEYNRCKYKGMSLAVSERKVVKAYFRPERPGHQQFHIVWKYESTDTGPHTSSSSRVLRFSSTIYIKPSLHVLPALVSKGEDQTLSLQVHRSDYMKNIELNTFYTIQKDDDARKFELHGSKDDAMDNEFTIPMSRGIPLQLDEELSPQERHFLKAEVLYSFNSRDDQIGLLFWNACVEGRDAKGYVLADISSDLDTQSMLGQLCGPASLNHNFSTGPLMINLELRITSNINEMVDATWMLGRTPHVQSVHAPPRVTWKGEVCGMQHDIQPDEKRFIILEAMVDRPGAVQIDSIYINWNSRSSPSLVGSLKIDPSSITVHNVAE